MGRIFGKALICAVGGLATWLLTAPIFPTTIGDPRWAIAEGIYVLLLCGLTGAGAGLHHGLMRGSRRAVITSTLFGLIFGAIGGMILYQIGSGLINQLYGPEIFTSEGPSIIRVQARMMAFAFLGAGLGAGTGLTLFTLRGVISGAVGGVVGGAVAGALFDPISSAFSSPILATQAGNEIGSPGRAVLAVLLAFAVGLFTAIFDVVTRRAWLRIEFGRNEGREWPIDAGQTMIGRDERAHVPLFADPNLPPLAAVIERQGGDYVLVDPGSPIGVGHNGMAVQSAVLRDGDTVNVGDLSLQFRLKSGAAAAAGEGRAKAQPITPVGQAVQPQPMASPVVQQPQPAAPTGFVLVALSGPLAGQKFPITHAIEVGREGAAIPLAHDSQASRRHARIEPGGAGIRLSDMGSTNGTFVDGQRITNAEAGAGQMVRIGSTEFRVERA